MYKINNQPSPSCDLAACARLRCDPRIFLFRCRRRGTPLSAMQLYEYYLNWIIHNLPYYLWHQYSIHAFGISISYINDNTMLINTV